jgi:solute carrier family 25 phosphate transporter 3
MYLSLITSFNLFAVSMLMFSTFEHTVDFLYKNVLGSQKSDCSKGVQLGVTCIAGYMSGVTGTFISNPADNIITAINKSKGVSVLQV